MAQTSGVFDGPTTEEALVAERQRFWEGFTTATMMAAGGVALLLILMAIFLL